MKLGLKSSFFNNRVVVNGSVFYIQIDDKQVAELDGETDIMQVRNAAEAHSQGFELEVKAKPAAGLDVFAGLGYTDVVFDDWLANERTGKFDYSDKELPNAPKYTANAGIQYRHASGSFW